MTTQLNCILLIDDDEPTNFLNRLTLEQAGCTRYIRVAQINEQTAVNGMVMEADGEVERVKVIGSPIHMDAAPVKIRIPPSQLGQYTDAVLSELGMSSVRAAE